MTMKQMWTVAAALAVAGMLGVQTAQAAELFAGSCCGAEANKLVRFAPGGAGTTISPNVGQAIQGLGYDIGGGVLYAIQGLGGNSQLFSLDPRRPDSLGADPAPRSAGERRFSM